ncbi:hypothetical protein ABPG74_006790 [Tetrahymena malaccensis]
MSKQQKIMSNHTIKKQVDCDRKIKKKGLYERINSQNRKCNNQKNLKCQNNFAASLNLFTLAAKIHSRQAFKSQICSVKKAQKWICSYKKANYLLRNINQQSQENVQQFFQKKKQQQKIISNIKKELKILCFNIEKDLLAFYSDAFSRSFKKEIKIFNLICQNEAKRMSTIFKVDDQRKICVKWVEGVINQLRDYHLIQQIKNQQIRFMLTQNQEDQSYKVQYTKLSPKKETKVACLKDQNQFNQLSQTQRNKIQNKQKQRVKIDKYFQRINKNESKSCVQLLGGSENKNLLYSTRIIENYSIINDNTLPRKRQKNNQLLSYDQNQIEIEEQKQDEHISNNTISIEEQNNEFKVDDKQLMKVIDQLCIKYNNLIQKDDQIEIKKNNNQEIIIEEIKNENFQFAQEGVDRICDSELEFKEEMTKNDNSTINQQYERIYLSQLMTKNKKQRNLIVEDLDFLKSIFRLGEYINSGGEADIFVNLDEQIAFRIIKIVDKSYVQSQLQEVYNIQQLQEGQQILDFDMSYLIEDKINNQIYIVHIMQICQMSLLKFLNSVSEFSLSFVLKIIFNSLHFLILLRQAYIYHSDIKPGNILKINNQYKLSDFGASQKISICNPTLQPNMWTPGYIPKNQINKNQPFYHDIYSVAQTIKNVLSKLKTHQEIKQRLLEQVKILIEDNENSVKIDCFQLPGQFVNSLIFHEQEKEIGKFFEKYLEDLEQYFSVNKKNKIFKYESELQYAEIALKILETETINMNTKKFYLTSEIKIKALLNQPLEISLDSDTWQLYYIFLDLKQSLFDIANTKIDLINDLIDKYEKIMPIQHNLKYDKEITYEEQKRFYQLQQNYCNKYKNLLNDDNNLQQNEKPDSQDFSVFNQVLHQKQEERVFDEIKYIKEILTKIKRNSSLNQQQNQIIKYFDCPIFNLSFIGSQEHLISKIKQFYTLIQSQMIIKQLFLDEEIINGEISNLTIKFDYHNKSTDLILKQKEQSSLLIKLNYKDAKNQVVNHIINFLQKNLSLNELSLNLSKNYINAKQVQTITNAMKKCPILTELNLDLGNNTIYAEGAQFIAIYLQQSQIFVLINLDLSQNQIGDVGVQLIASALQQNQMLTQFNLNLDSNDISDKGAKFIALSLEKCNNLTQLSLYLCENNIKHKEAQRIKSDLEKNKQFTQLDIYLSDNQDNHKKSWSNSKAKQYEESLKPQNFDEDDDINYSTKSIQEDYYSNSQQNLKSRQVESKINKANYDDSNIQDIFLNFTKKNQNEVTQLSLTLNIDIIGRSFFLPELTKLFNQEVLFLNCKQIGSKEASNIPIGLEKCTNFIHLKLDLSNNKLNVGSALSISTALEKCKNLSQININLEKNDISFLGANSIVISLENSLQITQISLNFKKNNIGDLGTIFIQNRLEKFKNIAAIFELHQDQINYSAQEVQIISKNLEKYQDILLRSNLNLSAQNIARTLEIFENIFSSNLLNNASSVERALEIFENTLQNLKLNWNIQNVNEALTVARDLQNYQNSDELNINLNKNRISGERALIIATSLEKYKEKAVLNLNTNENLIDFKEKESISNAPQECQHNKKLELNLSKNQIGLEGIQSISSALEQYHNIVQLNLNLSTNKVLVEEAKCVARILEQKQQMTQLDLNLSFNKIGHQGAQVISSSLQKCQNMSELHLNLIANNIKAEGVKSFANASQHLPNLTNFSLYLSNNNIGLEGAKDISQILMKNQNQTELMLNLNNNNLGFEGVEILVQGQNNLQRITKLKIELSWNKIGTNGSLHIANSLKKCQKITQLDLILFNNQIGYQGVLKILEALIQSSNIAKLNLNLQQTPFDLFNIFSDLSKRITRRKKAVLAHQKIKKVKEIEKIISSKQMQDQLKDFTTINQVQAQIFTQSTIDQSTQKQITQKTDQLTNLTKIKQNGNIIMLIQQNSEHLKQKFHFSLEKYFNLSIKTQLQQKIASNQEIDNIYFNLQDDLDQHLINILQNLITNENTLLRQFFNKMYGLNQIAHLQKLKLEQFYVKAFKVELRKHLKLEISFRLYDEDNINEQEQIVNQHYLLTKSKKQYLKINEVYISKLEQLKLETYYLALSKNLNYLKKLQSFNNQIEGQIANIQSKQIILLTIKLQESILKGILSTNQIKLKRIILNNKNEDLQTKQNSLSQIQRQTVLNLISKNKINQSQNKQQLLAVKSIFQNKQNQILKIQNDKCKLLGGGSCGSKGKDQTLNSVAKNQKQKQMQQIMSQKEQLKDKFQIYSDQEQENNDKSTQNFLSNQIANASLKSIHLFDAKKLLVITTKMSVFEVDTKTLKVINSFKFSHSIANLSINKSKYMITLSSRQIYLGDIQNGFTLLDPHKIQAEKALFFNNLIITSVSNKITLYNLQDLSIIKTNEESNCDLNISSISIDGKFLAVAYKNTCQIYNLEKEFGLIHTIQEHSSPITSIAFSSNNKYLATSSEDFTCKLWNIENNFEFIHKIQAKTICFNFVAFSHDSKYIATASKINCKLWSLEKQFEQVDCIQGHFQPITSVAFSPNCKYFASSSEDNTFNVWNLQNGCQLIKSIKEKENWITSIAFSADNKYLATGSWDKTCRIYDIESDFKLSYTIQLENPIAAIAFSSDGKYLATGSYENSCKIWNAQKAFELLYTIKGHSWEVVSVTFSSDVKYLATGSVDNTCKIWVVEKGFELLHTIQGHKNKISSVCFSSDSKYLATGSEDQTSKIWDVEKKFELIKTISEHKKQITSVSFSADGRYFATGSEDNTCKLFSVQNGFDLVSTIQRNINWITSLTFSADGKYLAIGTHNSDCKIFNTEKGFEIIDKNQCHTLEITSVAISADGKYLATGSSDNSCKIWNIQKGFQLITTIVGHTKEISTVAFSGDGKFLVTGSKDNTCKIWSVEKGFEYLTTIKEHIYFISSINFSADGKYLATGSEDNTCIVWSVSEQFTLIQKIKQHESKITSVSFSADSKYLATGSFDNTCKIWNVENGFQLMKSIEDQTQEITSVAFSQDGKYLATGLKDNTCKIWNVLKNFELFQVIQGHNSVVTSVSFSSNSKYLSTASKDKTFKIWDIERGFQLIDTIEAHISSITSITFSADSKYIITGSEDKSCKIWNLEKILEVQSQHKLMKTQETVIQADKVQKQSTISEVEANYIKLMYQI